MELVNSIPLVCSGSSAPAAHGGFTRAVSASFTGTPKTNRWLYKCVRRRLHKIFIFCACIRNPVYKWRSQWLAEQCWVVPVIFCLIYFRRLQFFKGDRKKLARGTLESPTATSEMNRVKKHAGKKTTGPEQWGETLGAHDLMVAASPPLICLFLSPFITLFWEPKLRLCGHIALL